MPKIKKTTPLNLKVLFFLFDKVFMFVYTGAEFDYYLNFIFYGKFQLFKNAAKGMHGQVE